MTCLYLLTESLISRSGTNNLRSIGRLKIFPEEENIDINGVAFELSGITYMPKTNHFACLFKCSKYYTYDDMRTDNWLELIGTIEDVVSNNHICNTSSIYHYTKVISQ